MSYYICFNKNLEIIDQVIPNGEVVKFFMKGQDLRISPLRKLTKVIPVYNQEELKERVKYYIDLKQSKEQEDAFGRGPTK